MKRIFALLLALLLLSVTLVACSDKEEDETSIDELTNGVEEMVYAVDNDYGDVFYYKYINVDEVSITGYAGSHVLHEVTVPQSIVIEAGDNITNFPVTDIADDAFKAKTNITKIALPDSVTSIGDLAFYGCTELKEIGLPANLTAIGVSAFAKCEKLSKISFFDKLTSIGEAAFFECTSLSAIELPVGVTELSNRLFMNCKNLRSVTWSANGKVIGDSVFMGCTFLRSVTFPETLEKIGDFAFAACGRLDSVRIGANVKKIGLNAFYACWSVVNVTFAEQENWRVKETLDQDTFDAMDVSNAENNAKALNEEYCNFYWERYIPTQDAD